MSNYTDLISRLNKKTGPINLSEIVELLEEQTLPAGALGAGSVERSVAGALAETVLLSNFGPRTAGGSALQKAIDHLGAPGGKIFIPPGVWSWDATPKLPRSLTGKLVIEGHGTVIALSPSVPRVFDLDYTADHQTFRNYDIGGFTVDGSAMTQATGSNHVLLGSLVNGAWIGRFNASNIRLHDIVLMDIPTHYSTSPNYCSIFPLTPFHSTADEETQSTVTGITLERVFAHGGDGGFQINGFCGGGVKSANIYFDDINILDCGHFLPTPAPNSYAVSNLHIGGYGFGDRCRIVGFRGTGSGDNGIEINAMQRMFIDDIDLEGMITFGLYLHNYHAAQDVDRQRLNVGKSHCELTKLGSRAFGFGSDSAASNPVGHLHLGSMSVHCSAGWVSNGTAILAAPNGAGTKDFRSLSYERLTITADVSAQTISSDLSAAFVTLKPNNEALIEFGQTSIHVYGTPAISGNPNIFPRLFEFLGNNLGSIGQLDVICDTAYSAIWINYISANASVDLNLSGHRYKSSALSTTSFRINGTPFDSSHNLRLSNCALVGTDYFLANATQARYIFHQNVRMAAPALPAISTPSSSPVTYENLSYATQLYTVRSGTVSTVEYSFDGGSTWYQVGWTSGSIAIPHTGQIRVTYSAAPQIYRQRFAD